MSARWWRYNKGFCLKGHNSHTIS
uniref:Uncharacterized protein n=1 Tax=Anguilla anguilla TaxID=7936 RepID=A0A0E9UV85_ANGAN